MIVPVMDLQDGQVVRAVAGNRQAYRPVHSPLTADARPETLARSFRQLGFETVYVADLDALQGRGANTEAYTAIASAGLRMWLDCGLGKPAQAELFCRGTWASLPERVIVPLESLQLETDLASLRTIIGERAVFSLDRRAGRWLTAIESWRDREPLSLVRTVVDSGFRRLLLLDLASVGMGEGPVVAELARLIHAAFPTVELTAGGGVRGPDDVAALTEAGCAHVLVASALHAGVRFA